MKKIPKRELIKLIISLPDGEEKRRFIARLVRTGEITEGHLSEMMIQDIHQNLDSYADMFRNDDVLTLLWNRFQAYPQYLARALVRVRPDVFYAYGFAFRLTMKLRADLGPIIVAPRGPGGTPTGSVFVKALPELVQANLLELDRERTLRTYLYAFSRDVATGYELLSDAVDAADNDYDGTLLELVWGDYERILGRTFPGFVTKIKTFNFPAPHVCWWIDKSQGVDRILNIGEPATQKTAYSVVTCEHLGLKRVVVTCPPHARGTWKREICTYFPDARGRVAVVHNRRELMSALDAGVQFTVIGYTTAIEEGVLDELCTVGFDGWIWDEAHYGNRATGEKPALRATFCQGLAERIPFKRVLALTATPFENDPKEMAAIASILRTDLFPTPNAFRQARPDDPRFLRELFDENILEITLREIMDLPPVSPPPWEDMLAATMVRPSGKHRSVYHFVREDDTSELKASQKVQRLLLTTVHPHKVQDKYSWPPDLKPHFDSWNLSTKLGWCRRKVREKRREGAKVVIATGIFAEGITRSKHTDAADVWVGQLLQEWFGKEHVLILDQNVKTSPDRTGTSERDRLIERWRTDPDAWILLVSMRCCPDNVNLSIPALTGITRLYVTALSYGWVSPEQFWGRFIRPQLGVPLEIEVPVLEGTIDQNLLNLIRRKWEAQVLFKAQVPLTADEMARLNRKVNIRMLAEGARSDIETVNFIGTSLQGKGTKAGEVFSNTYSTTTVGRAYAQAFLATQQHATAGHIARFMTAVTKKLVDQGLVHAQGILDGACGPLTLERFLDEPVYGVDFNPDMITLGRAASPHKGANAHVAELSQLPRAWGKKFELTTGSLVIDWTSKTEKVKRLPHRLAVLRELVRVTHPHGRVWLTMTESMLNSELMLRWLNALRMQGFAILDELTGLVTATDHVNGQKPFQFWSLCFSPAGRSFTDKVVDDYLLLFETARQTTKRHRNSAPRASITQRRVAHREFDITSASGAALDMRSAAKQAAEAEALRLSRADNLSGWQFHRAPTLDWRVLQALHERGLLDTI